jgi:hypothetical protein
MLQNQNPLAKTISKSIGKVARMTYKLGNLEEVVSSRIIDITDSHNSVIIKHPAPFKTTHRYCGEKTVTTMIIQINNILSFRIVLCQN